MGLFERLRKNPFLGYGLAGGLFVVAICVIVLGRVGGDPSQLKKSYYSVDDGKTYFADDIDKIYPFDYEGKPAYRAYVFKGSSGVAAVGYLERFTERGKSKMEALLKNPPNDGGAAAAAILSGDTEVKKPGTNQWVSATSPQRAKIAQPEDPTSVGIYP